MVYQNNRRPRHQSRPHSHSRSGGGGHSGGGRYNGGRPQRTGVSLPSPEIIEAYERLMPGAKDRLFAMAEKEMSHRHRMESGYLRAMRLSYRLGQIFSLVIAGYTLYTIMQLSGHGNTGLAIFVALLGFGYLFISIMVNKRQYGRFNNRNRHQRNGRRPDRDRRDDRREDRHNDQQQPSEDAGE